MNLKTKNWFAFCGFLLVVMLALASEMLVHFSFLEKMGINALIVAVIGGLMVGNLVSYPAHFTPGIQFAAKRILRLAIMLYGFRISFQEIISVGWRVSVLDIAIVSSTIFIGCWMGHKILKLDRGIAFLISAGSAICGAAAVLAIENVLQSEPYKAIVAIATVVIFSTLAMFLYPFLYQADLLGLTQYQFGIFAGASIHEVAQVVVAGERISSNTAEIAVIVKMIRVLLLIPVLLILTFVGKDKKNNLTFSSHIPWFALGFLIVIGIHSLGFIPFPWVQQINKITILLLAIAMGAIGMETKFSRLKHMGMKGFYLASILFGWLFVSSWVMIKILF